MKIYNSYWLLLIAALAGLPGCAGFRAAGARHAHIEKQVEKQVYNKPLSVVWPQARQLLFTEGYTVKDTDATNAETEWKYAGSFRTRYLLSGITTSDDTCQVQFLKSEEQRSNDGGYYPPDTKRDLGMEWKLLKKVAPDQAQAIEAEADAEAEKAKND